MINIVIHMEGGIIQSIHSNKPINYIIVDEDLRDEHEEERISDVYQEDGIFNNDFNEFTKVNDNEIISSKFKSIENNIINQPNISVEDAIDGMLKHGYIRHFWHIDDIKEIAKQMNIKLNNKHIKEIIRNIENVDSEYGVNWDFIKSRIEDVAN